jgi:hypothetical protein
MKKSLSRTTVLGAFAIGCAAPAAKVPATPVAVTAPATAKATPVTPLAAQAAPAETVTYANFVKLPHPMTGASDSDLMDAVAKCPAQPRTACDAEPGFAARRSELGTTGGLCSQSFAPVNSGGDRTVKIIYTLKDGGTNISGVCAPDANNPCGPLFCLDKPSTVTDTPASSKRRTLSAAP